MHSPRPAAVAEFREGGDTVRLGPDAHRARGPPNPRVTSPSMYLTSCHIEYDGPVMHGSRTRNGHKPDEREEPSGRGRKRARHAPNWVDTHDQEQSLEAGAS